MERDVVSHVDCLLCLSLVYDLLATFMTPTVNHHQQFAISVQAKTSDIIITHVLLKGASLVKSSSCVAGLRPLPLQLGFVRAGAVLSLRSKSFAQARCCR